MADTKEICDMADTKEYSNGLDIIYDKTSQPAFI